MYLLVNERTGKILTEFSPKANSTIVTQAVDFLLDCSDTADVDINVNDYAIYNFDYYGQTIGNLTARKAHTSTAMMHCKYTAEYDYQHKDEHKEEW